MAFSPSSCNAMESRPIVTCSPVEAITSSSRGSGEAEISLASAIRRFVSPDIADGTTMTSWPRFFQRAMRFATFLIRSVVATEVPPNFWTINAIPDPFPINKRKGFYPNSITGQMPKTDFLRCLRFTSTITRLYVHAHSGRHDDLDAKRFDPVCNTLHDLRRHGRDAKRFRLQGRAGRPIKQHPLNMRPQ